MTDTYTGAVKPGGPAEVRELAHLTITKVAVDEQMSNNAYLLRCKGTGDQVLIDDVEAKLFGTLPDDTWFYPGHGNDSTLGAERPHLAEWRERGW